MFIIASVADCRRWGEGKYVEGVFECIDTGMAGETELRTNEVTGEGMIDDGEVNGLEDVVPRPSVTAHHSLVKDIMDGTGKCLCRRAGLQKFQEVFCELRGY